MKEAETIALSDGRKLAYAEYGDPNGSPLFFFHGWPSSRLQAQVFDEAGRKSAVRIISPDRPGYGLSDFHSSRTLLDWPDDVESLASALRIKKFAAVGVSGGAPYAAVCAHKLPRRLTKVGIVVGLAPTNVSGVLQGMKFFNRFLWRSYHSFPWLMQVSSVALFLQARKHLPEYFSSAYRSKTDRAVLQTANLKQQILRNRSEAFRQGKRAAAKDLQIYTDDWGFPLQAIKPEVFLWYGDVDKQVSVEMGNYFARQIPRSQLTVYPNEGHLLIQTHAEEIIQTLINN